MSKVAVIVGSVRPRRNGTAYAKWVADVAKTSLKNTEVELVDIKDYKFRLGVEPGISKFSPEYVDETTRTWSKKIASFNGFIFVSPQYNWGVPGTLKTAIDLLYHEWTEKPAVIVTYGGHGGTQASEQLQTILGGGLNMKLAEKKPEFSLDVDHIGKNEGEQDAATLHAGEIGQLHEAFAQLQALLDKKE